MIHNVQEIIHVQIKVNVIMLRVLRTLNVRADITVITPEYVNILVLTVMEFMMNVLQISNVLLLMAVVMVFNVYTIQIANLVNIVHQMFVQVKNVPVMKIVVVDNKHAKKEHVLLQVVLKQTTVVKAITVKTIHVKHITANKILNAMKVIIVGQMGDVIHQVVQLTLIVLKGISAVMRILVHLLVKIVMVIMELTIVLEFVTMDICVLVKEFVILTDVLQMINVI